VSGRPVRVLLVAVHEVLVLGSYVYDDIEGDERNHGNLLHPNDAYTIFVDVCDAAAVMLAVYL